MRTISASSWQYESLSPTDGYNFPLLFYSTSTSLTQAYTCSFTSSQEERNPVHLYRIFLPTYRYSIVNEQPNS